MSSNLLSALVSLVSRRGGVPRAASSGLLDRGWLGTGGTGGGAKFLADDSTYKTVATEAFPVGSVYLNTNSASDPATLLGYGTWTSLGQHAL